MLNNSDIENKIKEKFGDAAYGFAETYGMLSFEAAAENNLKVLQYLFDELNYRFLTDICAVHYPERKGQELAVVYHVHNLVENHRLRFKIFVPVEKPDVFSATALFSGANWMERETYDFYGVNFIGHPKLTRVLNVNEMDYFPMRKEFPLEDQTRIDKDDEMFGRTEKNQPLIS